MSEADLAALRGVDESVSRETFDLLKCYEQEVCRWNARINLVSASSPRHLWVRHIVDCAQLAALKPKTARWLDLGSGGGLPGIVVAIMIRGRPGAAVQMVESNRKKSTFLASFASRMRLPVTVHACRIEDAVSHPFKPQIVTARALAPLPKLLNLASPWLSSGSIGLFQKGRDYTAEIAQNADAWRFDLIKHASRTDASGVILEISNLAAVK